MFKLLAALGSSLFTAASAAATVAALICLDLIYLAFPAPHRDRLDLVGALQPDPVLGRVETRSYTGRMLQRLGMKRTRAADSMAFIST